MPLETVTTLNTLNPNNPVHDDSLADCDSHLRNIKRSLQTTFPNVTGPVTVSHSDLNGTTNIAARLTTLEAASNHLTGPQVLPSNVAVVGALNVAGTFTVGGLFVVPRGVVVMWVGTVALVPFGWALCDGTQGTPNLFNRFVVAAGDLFTVGQIGGSASYAGSVDANGYHNHVGRTGDSGAHPHRASLDSQGQHNHGVQTGSHVLTTAEIPSHTHTLTLPNGPQGFATAGGGFPTGAGVQSVTSDPTGSDQGHVHGITDDGLHMHTVSVDPAGDHYHGINSDGQHAHTFAVATTPPYMALCFIMKL